MNSQKPHIFRKALRYFKPYILIAIFLTWSVLLCPSVCETRPEHLEESAKTGEAASEPLRSSKNPYYFVISENVKLHLIPSIPSHVVKVLKLNDKVEKISQSGTTWIKVRYLSTGAEGWAAAHYFRNSPVTNKNQISTNKKNLRQKTSSLKQKTQRPLALESLEPEGM
jgi:uncharacterized protein YgiM (DUF1202 family)